MRVERRRASWATDGWASEAASKHQADSQPQADGESLYPHRTDRIFALDERLTRQFGKTLAMLIRLREMRLDGPATAPRRQSNDRSPGTFSVKSIHR